MHVHVCMYVLCVVVHSSLSILDSGDNLGGEMDSLVGFGVTASLRPVICKRQLYQPVSPATCTLTKTSLRKTDTETQIIKNNIVVCWPVKQIHHKLSEVMGG